jgi:hypothetical protein
VRAWFGRHGVAIERVMTDNGSAYRSHAFRHACADAGLRHLRTRPYTPRTNGKAERFIQTALREWAYARPYASSHERCRAIAPWLHHYNHHRPHAGINGATPAQGAAARSARGSIDRRVGGTGPQPRSGGRSAATMRANQLRLWFASFAYVLLDALRRIALRHTQFAAVTCGTIRLKLLKIGAQVRTSVRRIKVAMASACPYRTEYHLAYLYLQRAAF